MSKTQNHPEAKTRPYEEIAKECGLREAKTSSQIWAEMASTSSCKLMGEEKWLPVAVHEADKAEALRDAQAHINRLEKEIQKLKDELKEDCAQYHEVVKGLKGDIQKLKEQIEEAVKILSEFPKQFPINPDEQGNWGIWHFKDLLKIIGRSRAALQYSSECPAGQKPETKKP